MESVCLVNDINEQPNIIGDGINAAQRIMNHAKPNEILVSRSYYENTSLSTQKLSTLFNGSGVKHENHILDYQAHLARLNQDQAATANQPSTLDPPLILTDNLKSSESSGFLNTVSWKYAMASLFILAALFAIVKLTI
ncbi:MAG: adenylate/guanylate cyclase domain-containing protein, partial [Methylotenera sp.]